MKNQMTTESAVIAEEHVGMIGESLVRELSADEISEVCGAVWVSTCVDCSTIKDSMFIN